MSNSCLRFLGTSVKPCQPLSNMSKRHRTPPPRDDMVDQKPNGKLEKIWPPAADDKIPPDRSTMGANADLKNRAACEAGPGKFCPVPPGPRPPEPLCQIPSKLRRASGPLSNYCRSVKSRRPRAAAPCQNRQIRQIPSKPGPLSGPYGPPPAGINKISRRRKIVIFVVYSAQRPRSVPRSAFPRSSRLKRRSVGSLEGAARGGARRTCTSRIRVRLFTQTHRETYQHLTMHVNASHEPFTSPSRTRRNDQDTGGDETPHRLREWLTRPRRLTLSARRLSLPLGRGPGSARLRVPWRLVPAASTPPTPQPPWPLRLAPPSPTHQAPISPWPSQPPPR